MSIHGEERSLEPKILVLGLGGTGCNAVNNMISGNLQGVNFCVANTDAQALEASLSERKIQLGVELTQGLGAGSDPEIGRKAAEESSDQIRDILEGNHMVFITAGMGGGTGTGAAHIVAKIAKEMGILTVGVVTKPFHFEGIRRMNTALLGIDALHPNVDTMLVIPNQNLFRVASNQTTFTDAFKMADDVLDSGIRGITDLVTRPGLINLDFADIRSVMRNMGAAMMGTGEAEGENRALEAVEMAISNPLLDNSSMKGAKAVLFNVTGSSNLTLFELDEAANRVREEVDSDANIIVGSAFNQELGDKIRISIFATGIDVDSKENTSASSMSTASKSTRNNNSSNSKAPYTQDHSTHKEELIMADSEETPNFASPDTNAQLNEQDQDVHEQGEHSIQNIQNDRFSQNEDNHDEDIIAQNINGENPFKARMAHDYEQHSDLNKIRYKDDKSKTPQKKTLLEKMSLGFSKMVGSSDAKRGQPRHDEDSIHTPAFLRKNPTKFDD